MMIIANDKKTVLMDAIKKLKDDKYWKGYDAEEPNALIKAYYNIIHKQSHEEMNAEVERARAYHAKLVQLRMDEGIPEEKAKKEKEEDEARRYLYLKRNLLRREQGRLYDLLEKLFNRARGKKANSLAIAGAVCVGVAVVLGALALMAFFAPPVLSFFLAAAIGIAIATLAFFLMMSLPAKERTQGAQGLLAAPLIGLVAGVGLGILIAPAVTWAAFGIGIALSAIAVALALVSVGLFIGHAVKKHHHRTKTFEERMYSLVEQELKKELHIAQRADSKERKEKTGCFSFFCKKKAHSEETRRDVAQDMVCA